LTRQGTVSPRISVVMSVFNARRYVARAIGSILDQTYREFEFLIINDGSTDGSEEVIRSYTDPRIRRFDHPNKGLAASLNRGILLSQGEYIARMDADDIALPTRLERQVRFLDEHPACVVVGTAAEVVGADDELKFVMCHPAEDVHIRWAILFDSPFVHSTVMYRREAVISVGLYNELGPAHVEDYEMWSRLAAQHRVANLAEPLLRYRDNPEGISHMMRAEQEVNALAVSARNISMLLGEPFPVGRARAVRNLRLVAWPKPSLQEVRQACLDIAAVQKAFEAKHAEHLGGRPHVWRAIRSEVARSDLAAALFAGQLRARDAAFRYLCRAMRRGPSLAISHLLWRAIVMLIGGPDFFARIRKAVRAGCGMKPRG